MRFWTVFISILILTGMIPTFATAAEKVDGVVAVVNNEPITLYELDKAMVEGVKAMAELKNRTEIKAQFKENREMALKKLIDEKLLDQTLAKVNIQVTDADIEKALQNVMKRNNLDMAGLERELSQKGTTLASYKQELQGQVKRIKFMGQFVAPRVKITDADLDEFFAKNSEQFGRFQSVEMAQIIIPLPPDGSDAQIASANQIAGEVIQKAKGGADFEELGKKYSENSQTAVKQIYQVPMLAPQIASILEDLQPGGVSEPVRSHLGLHVLKLYERKTMAGEEYKAIREQIREKVFEYKLAEELQDYLDGLREKSFIEIKS